MACNFLIKKATDEKYTHYFIDGCFGATAANAVTKYFLEQNAGITVSNFPNRPGTTCTRIWVKYIQGVSIIEELYEMSIGRTQMMKNHTLGNSPDNLVEGMALKPTLIDQKPPILLPYFSADV